MAFAERARYNFRVSKIESTEQQQNVKPTDTDFFTIEVTGTLRHISTYYSSRTHVTAVSTLFETFNRISCKHFFEELNHQNFLQYCIPNEWSSYFTSESLVLMTQSMIPKVQQLFGISSNISGHAKPISTKAKHHQDFPLALEIVVDMFIDGGESTDEEIMERAVMEESMQGVRMIPASKEAIQSLKKFVLPENCSICMENFHDEDVELSPMPCGHVFHHHCIVKWLQTSHVCPLCRYPMPTM